MIIRKYCMLFVTIFSFILPIFISGLSHAERLNLLKNRGFKPQVIYDIGAFRGTWTSEVRTIFKDSQFFLFEANEVHKPYLQKLGYPYFIALLGDQEKPVTFYSIDGTGDSIYREQTSHYKEGKCEEKLIQMTRLDLLVKKNGFPLPDLIKMDVQGAEKKVIEGSASVVSHAEVVILEVSVLEYNKNAPLLLEMISFMDKLGYNVLDFIELHYLPQTQELLQVDILFIKKNSSLGKSDVLI